MEKFNIPFHIELHKKKKWHKKLINKVFTNLTKQNPLIDLRQKGLVAYLEVDQYSNDLCMCSIMVSTSEKDVLFIDDIAYNRNSGKVNIGSAKLEL